MYIYVYMYIYIYTYIYMSHHIVEVRIGKPLCVESPRMLPYTGPLCAWHVPQRSVAFDVFLNVLYFVTKICNHHFRPHRAERDTCVVQCVAVCCSVLQCVAVCCSMLQRVAVCCFSVLQRRPHRLERVAVCCSVLQCAIPVCCSVFITSAPPAPSVLQ